MSNAFQTTAFQNNAFQTGTPTYSIIGSGGSILGGITTVAFTKMYSVVPTAGMLIGGTATVAFIKTYSVVPTAGVLIGGTATVAFNKMYSVLPTAGMLVGGDGGVLGTNVAIATYFDECGRFVSNFGFSEQGSAGWNKINEIGRWISRSTGQTQEVVGVGGIILGGTATFGFHKTYAVLASAGALLGGTADIIYNIGRIISGSGGVLAGGIANIQTHHGQIISPIGGCIIGGVGTVLRGNTTKGVYGGIIGGEAIIFSSQLPSYISGNGGFILGGTSVNIAQIYFKELKIIGEIQTNSCTGVIKILETEMGLRSNSIHAKVLM